MDQGHTVPYGAQMLGKQPPWPRWQVLNQNETISLTDQSSVWPLLGFLYLERSWVTNKSKWKEADHWGVIWGASGISRMLLSSAAACWEPGAVRKEGSTLNWSTVGLWALWIHHWDSAAYGWEKVNAVQNCIWSLLADARVRAATSRSTVISRL